MKKYYKYVGLCFLSLGVLSCDTDDVYSPITEPVVDAIAVSAGSADFSKYVAVGASFTAGFTDGALFKAGQKNSFPNILASKFAMDDDGNTFTQPLMNDNIGGYLIGGQQQGEPRLYFNGVGPVRLSATPTTEIGNISTGPYSNMGVPGIKSYHLSLKNYGALAALPNANPYFIRMASSPGTSVLEDVLAQKPTFFSLSEIGGNDILDYAVKGGYDAVNMQDAIYQEGNLDPSTYGANDITDPNVFAASFSGAVDALTAGGAKGVVATVPYITSLPYFTTVPYNPLDPTTNTALAGQISLVNTIYGALNQIYTSPQINQPNRVVEFSATATNPVVIIDESLTDLSATIEAVLGNPKNTAFISFVKSMGFSPQVAPFVARLFGQQFGQARPATADDLFVLPSSSVIGTVNTTHAGNLIAQSHGLLSITLAGLFSAEGVTLPLADKWVLTADEVSKIKTATDAYNTTITAVAAAKGLALVDFGAILTEASTTGIQFDTYTLTTGLVSGGLVSLDGIHLTGRGYALMANKMLEAIDTTYGSNFTTATDGLAKADDYPTNYSPGL